MEPIVFTILKPILLYLVVILFAYIDYEHWLDNDFIEDHDSRFLLRGFVVLFLSGYMIPQHSTIQFIGLGMMFAGSFDIVLNKMKGFKWDFHGTTADWDIWWNKRPKLYRITMIVLNVLGLSIYILRQTVDHLLNQVILSIWNFIGI